MSNLLKSFDVPLTIPSVVRAYYEHRPDHAQAMGRDKVARESFMNYQLRLVKDLIINAQGGCRRPALETASLNRRLRSEDFDDITDILERMVEHDLLSESELMRALQNAYEVRETLFGDALKRHPGGGTSQRQSLRA